MADRCRRRPFAGVCCHLALVCGLATTGAVSAGGPNIAGDDFSDDALGDIWALRETHPSVLQAIERNQRLEFPSGANGGVSAAAAYVSNGWAINGTQNIQFRIDWHFDPPAVTGDVGFTIGVSVEADPALGAGPENGFRINYGRDDGTSYFEIVFYDDGVADVVARETIANAPTDGTFYVEYGAAGDLLRVSTTGYGDPGGVLIFNASGGLVFDELALFVGAYSRRAGGGFTGAEVWVDNLVLDLVTLFNVPFIDDPLSGFNSIWLMDGTTRLPGSGPTVPLVDTTWIVAGTGDFDMDGRSDILWRRLLTGANAIWFMNGRTRLPGSGPLSWAGLNWMVAGVGDFNGDTMSDILWRNENTGANAMWIMDGRTKLPASGPVPATGLNWIVAGVGDFDGDGKADLLWRNEVTGVNVIWLMDGTIKRLGSGPVPATGLNWTVAGTSDFDGDGNADILWRNQVSGANWVWLMDGTTKLGGSGLLPRVGDTNWVVADVCDFTGDSRADILWRHR